MFIRLNMEKSEITFWKTIGIQANKFSTESLCLREFKEKYIKPYSELLDFKENIFDTNYSLSRNAVEKNQFLMNWFIKSRIQSFSLLDIYETSEPEWDKFSNKIKSISDKLRGFTKLFKKYHSKIRFIAETINDNEKSISWLYKIQNKVVKREVIQLNENKFLDDTTYLIITFRPKKVLVSVSFGDINRRIEGKIKKPLSKMLNYKLEIGIVKEECNLNKILEKIIKHEGIKGISFRSSKLNQTPHLEIISRKNYKNICSALKELADKNIISQNLEDVDFFILNIDKRNIPIKLHHRKIAGYRTSVIFDYNEAKLNDKELRELKVLDINNNCLYLDNTKVDKKKELEELLNRSHQLNYYEQLAFDDIITKLMGEGLLKKENSEPPTISYSIQYEEIYNKIIESINVLKAKKMNEKNILGKKSSTMRVINVEFGGENNLIVLFFREPSESTIKRIERKWLDGEIPAPIFISLKEEFLQKLTDKNVNHIQLTEIVYSLFFDKNILSFITSKLEKSKEDYRLKYEKDLSDSIKEVESIVKDTSGKDRNKDFERAVYVIMKGLFRDVVKMGGPNVPDGGLRFGIQNRALWDAKLWIKTEFCNKVAEIDKIKVYCRASKKEKAIQEFGGVKEYYLIGKIKDYNELENKVFNPIHKELKKKYGLKIQFRYLDVGGTILKLIKFRNTIPPDKVKDYNFYDKIIASIGENKIITDIDLEIPPLPKKLDVDRVKPFRNEVSKIRHST